MKSVSIVTATRNTSDDTHNFLTSLRKVTTKDVSLQTIIVDNGPDNPFHLNAEESKQSVTLIQNEKNTGFTGGYNLGMQKALDMHADYILIVNNDTILSPGMLTNLMTVLDSDKKIGAVVPKIYFAKGHEFHKDRYTKSELGHVLWYAGGYMDWDNVTSIHRGVDEVDHGQYNKTEEVGFASGCCMLFKADVLRKLGLLDDKYFLYYEDADINERIKRAGYVIYYVPTATLVHVNAASSGGSGNNLQDYFLTRNQMLFGMRYAPLRAKIALIRQSIRFLLNGRPMQKRGIIDFYLRRFNKGTYFDSVK